MPLTELLSLSDPDLFQVIQASQPQDILTILQDTDSPLAPRIRSFLRRKDGKRVERYLKTVPQLGLKQDPQSLYRIGQVAQRLLERGQIATWIHQSLSTG
jgi:flagellar motor switch protein FliG